IPPTITCPADQSFCEKVGGNYTIPEPVIEADNCGAIQNITYVITGVTNRNGTGADASGNFNVGVSTVTWTVDNGCETATCSIQVTINPLLESTVDFVLCANEFPATILGHTFTAP